MLGCTGCWVKIKSEERRCKGPDCKNRKLEQGTLYLTEDTDDVLSKERDAARTLKVTR